MDASTYIVVLITTGSEEEASKIANALLNERVAACVNTLTGVSSSFWWQGKLDTATESLLIVKTKAMVLDRLIRLVRALHSYEVPEIIALPVIGGNPDYLDWIAREVK